MTKANNNPYASAIINTLKYRAIFKYPLTKYQLYNTLITGRQLKEKPFLDELKRLVKRGEVKTRKNLYYLSGYKPVDWEKRGQMSARYLVSAQQVAKVLSVIPWIKLIGVTGSVANFNAEKKGDIDFFIVTQKNRIWLTRGFTVILLILLGKYRTDKSPEGKVCPNIFVDESHMNWPKSQRNVFTAQQIVSMHPLLNRDNAYFRLVKANQWIFEYTKTFKISFLIPKTTEKVYSRSINLLEKTAWKLQKAYMKRKISKEVIRNDFIHFNRDDWTHKILGKYQTLTKSK